MPVRGLRPGSDPKEIAQQLMERHPQLLAPTIVSQSQVERLVSRLIEHVTVKHVQKKEGSQYPSAAASNTELLPRSIGLPPAAAALTRPVAGRRAGVSARPPLESVSTAPSVAEAAQAPAVLSAAHNGALSDLSDLESIPDLPDASDSLPSIQSRADGAGRVIAGDGAVVGSSGSSGNARRSNGDSSTTSASPPDIPEDLNRVSEEELKRAKEAMNATFEAHALKPGDPGYVHDKVVIFDGEKEANDWDDELSDVSEPSEDEFAKEMALLAKGM